MESTRIRVKIGEHEFEAEGPTETVQSQFDAFKELISSAPRQISNHPAKDKSQTDENNNKDVPVDFAKIMRVQGRVVSLTALPTSTEDAALLIMLGHMEERSNESVTGQEIGDGLNQSGRPVPRVDRLLDKAIAEALVLKSGIKRATRYRLTNQGHIKALEIAKGLMASLP